MKGAFFMTKDQTEIITFGNFKGGVGKTSSTKMVTYILSEFYDKKCLAVDMDAQGNLSTGLAKTFGKELDKSKTIFRGLFSEMNEDPSAFVQEISPNIDLLAGDEDLVDFEYELSHYDKKYHKEMLLLFLEPIRDNYDYILIDTSPLVNIVTDNVMKVTDWVMIPTQTAADALESSQKFYNYLFQLDQTNKYSFDFLGVLSYLVGDSATNQKYIERHKEIFEEDVFTHLIKRSNVVERWADSGITERFPYDKVTLTMYQKVVEEMLERIHTKKLENGDVVHES